MKIDPKKLDKLTEHKESFKLYNPEIMEAFGSLCPAGLSKLALVVFNTILVNKRNVKTTSRFYSEQEDRRIYSNTYVSLEGILDLCNPSKYSVDNKDKQKDISNLMKKIHELDEKNIFHIWRYGSPFTYMFIIERYLSSWEPFNKDGCVLPKTLKKVIRSSNGIIESMVRMEKSRKRPVKLKDIEASYMKDLIGHLISKMDKGVAKKLPLWDGKQTLAEYLDVLRPILKDIDDFEGLHVEDNFLKKLPPNLRNKMTEKKQKEKKMDLAQLSKDLVPDDENIVKEKKTRAKRTKAPHTDSIKAKRTGFKAIDPFSNCNQFMKFYKEVIRLYNRNAKFYPADAERVSATQIMDLLIENGKSGDKDFLRSWIRYYIGSYLQGGNVYKQERTSLNNFKKTFKTYESKYFRG